MNESVTSPSTSAEAVFEPGVRARLMRVLRWLLLTCCCALSLRSTAGRVDHFPIDRFDDYPASTLPPHPWAATVPIPAGVTLDLQTAAESPFCNNLVTGKGLVCDDTSTTAGQDVGIHLDFGTPPEGDFYLGFDFQYSSGSSLDLVCALTGSGAETLAFAVGAGHALTITDRTGAVIFAPALVADTWYHVGLRATKFGWLICI